MAPFGILAALPVIGTGRPATDESCMDQCGTGYTVGRQALHGDHRRRDRRHRAGRRPVSVRVSYTGSARTPGSTIRWSSRDWRRSARRPAQQPTTKTTLPPVGMRHISRPAHGPRAYVDAVVVIGGPVHAAFTNTTSARCGVACTTSWPTPWASTSGQSWRSSCPGCAPSPGTLPDTAGNAPMLVINGDADPYVPVEDTLMSSGAGTPRSCSLRAAATARSTATRGRQRRARLLTTDVTCRHQGTHEVTIPDSSVAATLVGACARPQLCAELLIHPISCASGTMPSAAVNLSSQQSAPCLVADGHVSGDLPARTGRSVTPIRPRPSTKTVGMSLRSC